MADNNEEMNELQEVDQRLEEIDKMFETPSVFKRLKILFTGLGKPRSSKEYKEAVIEAQRLCAPIAAVVLPIIAVLVLAMMSKSSGTSEVEIESQIMEAETLKDLDEIKPEDMPEPPDMQEVTFDTPVDTPNVTVDNAPPTPNQPISAAPAPMEAVTTIKSPVILKNVYGSFRNAGSRAAQMRRYGGDPQTEAAVLNALRWLKKNQQSDGSWAGSSKTAMTGLAILTFLAHGEKPGDSEEFGETVQRALEFLLKNQKSDGRFNHMDGNQYALPIATYAMCEAFGMTLNPDVKEAALKALKPIIDGQHPTGGWTYKCDPKPGEGGAYRDDTSYMGWCAQALKAAKLSNLHADGLQKAIKLAIKGFKKNGHPEGGFGYTSKGRGGLTSVGALSMMLLGAVNDTNVKKSLNLMENWQPFFASQSAVKEALATVKAKKDDNPGTIAAGNVNKTMYEVNKMPNIGNCPQYYFYYATQCKFHEGGKRWENWNKRMKPAYIKEQIVEQKAYKDAKGNEVSIGHWENTDVHTARPVMDTCLAALQLMVYYRYLPTTSKEAIKAEEEVVASSTDTDDIKVDDIDL